MTSAKPRGWRRNWIPHFEKHSINCCKVCPIKTPPWRTLLRTSLCLGIVPHSCVALPSRILSKILTVSESTLIYRKRLRSIYRDDQNEQRTVRQIQYGRLKYVEIQRTGRVKRSESDRGWIPPSMFSYGPLDKPLIQYPNGNSLKYPYHIQFQPQIFTSHNLFHRSQTQRRNHQRWIGLRCPSDLHWNGVSLRSLQICRWWSSKCSRVTRWHEKRPNDINDGDDETQSNISCWCSRFPLSLLFIFFSHMSISFFPLLYFSLGSATYHSCLSFLVLLIHLSLFVVFLSSNENKKRSWSLRIPAENKTNQKKSQNSWKNFNKKKIKRPFFVNTYKNISVISFCARAFFLSSSSLSCHSHSLSLPLSISILVLFQWTYEKERSSRPESPCPSTWPSMQSLLSSHWLLLFDPVCNISIYWF